MANEPRIKKVNHRVERLLREALEASGLNIEELGKNTRWGRANAGALIRGEVQRIAPEQAAGLAKWLLMTEEEILDAYGFNIRLTPERQVPKRVAQAWANLPRKTRHSMLEVMLAAASGNAEEEEMES